MTRIPPENVERTPRSGTRLINPCHGELSGLDQPKGYESIPRNSLRSKLKGRSDPKILAGRTADQNGLLKNGHDVTIESLTRKAKKTPEQ